MTEHWRSTRQCRNSDWPGFTLYAVARSPREGSAAAPVSAQPTTGKGASARWLSQFWHLCASSPACTGPPLAFDGPGNLFSK
eukprot:9398020-Pyramimonas_sp.AAC.1